MGNQGTKGSSKGANKLGQDAEKKSRTNWTAGTTSPNLECVHHLGCGFKKRLIKNLGVSSPPGRPSIELSSR